MIWDYNYTNILVQHQNWPIKLYYVRALPYECLQDDCIETLRGIENELKLKWQNEELKEKISSLQNELNEVKYQYKCGELSNYRLREIIREKERRLSVISGLHKAQQCHGLIICQEE